MHRVKSRVPQISLLQLIKKKKMMKKGVRERLVVKRKLRASKVK
jgi:hypothetical protein